MSRLFEYAHHMSAKRTQPTVSDEKIIKETIVGTNLRKYYGDGKAFPSMSQFAAKVGMHSRTMGRIINGEQSPTVEILDRICEKLDGVFTWQLLVPWFDPSNPPVLKFVNAKEEAAYKIWKRSMDDLRRADGENGK